VSIKDTVKAAFTGQTSIPSLLVPDSDVLEWLDKADKSDALVAKISARIEDERSKSAERHAEQTRKALEAFDAGDETAITKIEVGRTSDSARLATLEDALTAARQQAADYRRQAYNARVANNIKRLKKLLAKRTKRTTRLGETTKEQATAYHDVTEVNQEIREFLVSLGLRVPNDAALNDRELHEFIAKELFRLSKWNGIGDEREHLIPGARTIVYQGNPDTWPSLADELHKRDDYILKVVEAGPAPIAPEPVPIEAFNPPPSPVEAPTVQLNPIVAEAPAEGPVTTAAHVMASGHVKRVTLFDDSARCAKKEEVA
jgi:hypothetical protein